MTEVDQNAEHPSISVKISLDPAGFIENEGCELIVEATLHHTRHITVFTWPTVLNPRLGQQRGNFTCRDLTVDQDVNWKLSKIKRPGFRCDKGSHDEAYFCTLEPEVPVIFRTTFILGRDAVAKEAGIVPGRRYRFGVKAAESIRDWKEGTRDEVMSPEGERRELHWVCKPISLDNVVPVDFVVNSDGEISSAEDGEACGEELCTLSWRGVDMHT